MIKQTNPFLTMKYVEQIATETVDFIKSKTKVFHEGTSDTAVEIILTEILNRRSIECTLENLNDR